MSIIGTLAGIALKKTLLATAAKPLATAHSIYQTADTIHDIGHCAAADDHSCAVPIAADQIVGCAADAVFPDSSSCESTSSDSVGESGHSECSDRTDHSYGERSGNRPSFSSGSRVSVGRGGRPIL